MIVFSAGMPKSGSAWYFNLTNDLLIAAGHEDVRDIRARYGLQSVLKHHNCNIDKHTTANVLRVVVPHLLGHTFAVKTHDSPTRTLRALMAAGVVKAAYIYRDPRDVAVSAFDHGERLRSRGEEGIFTQATNLEAAILLVKRWLLIWEAWMHCPNVITTRYEDLLADPAQALARLAAFIGLDVPGATIQQVVDGYAPAQLSAGKAGHVNFNKGVVGRYREVMSQRELDLCQEHFGPYLQQMGYAG
ncbi:MAG: hypothetical protein Kow00120_24120 [Anaerolineae bacterium]